MWQDYLITTGGFVLIASLLTMVRLKDRWYIPNAIILGTVLGAYGVAFATMSMLLSSSVMVAQSVLWTTIALQKMRSDAKLSGESTPQSGTTTRGRPLTAHERALVAFPPPTTGKIKYNPTKEYDHEVSP